MIEENENNSHALKYVPQMNFSYFTNKYYEMLKRNFPTDYHHQIQKKWVQLIRKAMRASNIQVVVIFLYSSKIYSSHCKQVLTNLFKEWKKRYQERSLNRSKWIQLSKFVVSQNRDQFFDQIKDHMHNIRTNRTIRYFMTLPQYNMPDYIFFFNQVNNSQFDDETIKRIGYRKREKDGMCTTTTQTHRKDVSDFEFENSDSSI